MKTIIRFFNLLLSLYLIVGCQLINDSIDLAIKQAAERTRTFLREGDIDTPARQNTSSRNPFNDVITNTSYDNCLGFFSGGICYRQPFRAHRSIFESPEFYYFTRQFCDTERDTVIISSIIAPWPDSFYGNLSHHNMNYFSEIAFLFRKDMFDSDKPIILDGKSVALFDQRKTRNEVSYARIEFLDPFTPKGYNRGTFVVTYKTLSGETEQLTDGCFKLRSGDFNDECIVDYYTRYFPI